jgi:hypothetical protein
LKIKGQTLQTHGFRWCDSHVILKILELFEGRGDGVSCQEGSGSWGHILAPLWKWSGRNYKRADFFVGRKVVPENRVSEKVDSLIEFRFRLVSIHPLRGCLRS